MLDLDARADGDQLYFQSAGEQTLLVQFEVRAECDRRKIPGAHHGTLDDLSPV